MVPRKQRTPVVLDTNVFVRAFKSRLITNANRRIVRLWLIERRLQLVVSRELVEEYLGVFREVLALDEETLTQWEARFAHDPRCTLIGLGRRFVVSRDPDDDLLLAVASSGRAKFLVTNDRDLLELPSEARQVLRFEILSPRRFLATLDDPRGGNIA